MAATTRKLCLHVPRSPLVHLREDSADRHRVLADLEAVGSEGVTRAVVVGLEVEEVALEVTVADFAEMIGVDLVLAVVESDISPAASEALLVHLKGRRRVRAGEAVGMVAAAIVLTEETEGVVVAMAGGLTTTDLLNLEAAAGMAKPVESAAAIVNPSAQGILWRVIAATAGIVEATRTETETVGMVATDVTTTHPANANTMAETDTVTAANGGIKKQSDDTYQENDSMVCYGRFVLLQKYPFDVKGKPRSLLLSHVTALSINVRGKPCVSKRIKQLFDGILLGTPTPTPKAMCQSFPKTTDA